MTIKEFSNLCGCNPQTIRYYDRMNLLTPVKVDDWTGYRFYDEEQALDFVKIKNLQTAGFSIDEIKGLLNASDEAIYDAFSQKIKEQEEHLKKMIEIRESYQNEITMIKNKIKELHSSIKNSMETYPQMAAKIPMKICKNGQHQVSLVIYSIEVNTLIGSIVENVKSPKSDLIGENSSSSK